jgi:ribosomal protein S7
MNFLSCLDVPAVAEFRDSPVYVDAAEEGLGVMDMIDIRAARKEAIAWKNLVKWINCNLNIKEAFEEKVAKQPLAASRKETTIIENHSRTV